MPFKVDVKLDLPGADQVVKDVGLGPNGMIQNFHTLNVARRMEKYMPMVSGAFIKTTMAHINLQDATITSTGPQAAFLYHGLLMLGDVTGSAWAAKGETKHVTETPLEYNQEKNAQAGPYWDRALIAKESAVLVKELQNYIDYLARQNK